MAVLIEMSFSRTRVDSGNHVLHGGSDPHRKGQFRGAKGRKVQRHLAVPCAKTAEPIEMPFGLWARMGVGIVC